MESKDIKIGIGDLNIAAPPDKLITLGLGSCVGIALFDSTTKIVGLAHIMLPNSSNFQINNNPMKFADKAIPLLIEKMVLKGVNKRNIRAKIAGGASMFSFADKSPVMEIGLKNGIAVKNVLQLNNIPVLSEDLGGSIGRTMIVESGTCRVFVKSIGKGIKEL